MYSKNDYRYYLEHRMAEENYLAHYGVKNMKWGKHKNPFMTPTAQYQKVSDAVETRNKYQIPWTAENTNNILTGAIKKQNRPSNRIKNKVTDVLKPKNQKVEIITNKKKKPSKKIKNPLAPKNQKVEIITNKKKKRSKREAKWNKKMQNYGREILSEQKR